MSHARGFRPWESHAMEGAPVKTAGWLEIFQTPNMQFYAVEDGVIAAVPAEGALEDGSSAAENLRQTLAYWVSTGRGGVVLVFLDRLASQDKDARRVFQDVDRAWFHGVALIGGTLLSRAMGSFFGGMNKPNSPVKMFRDVPEALAWARAVNAQAGRDMAQ